MWNANESGALLWYHPLRVPFHLPLEFFLVSAEARARSLTEVSGRCQLHLFALFCCSVHASRKYSKRAGSFSPRRRSAWRSSAFCVTRLDSRSDWNTGGVKGACTHIDPLWNKVSNSPPWNRQGLFPSMSPLMLNHHRPPPTNPSAEIPGFVDLSLLIDTKWSVSLLMNLWNQVVTIYFIPNNFFQTLSPCLSLCLTWVLIKRPVMCLKCRRPALQTGHSPRTGRCARSAALSWSAASRLLVYTEAALTALTNATNQGSQNSTSLFWLSFVFFAHSHILII